MLNRLPVFKALLNTESKSIGLRVLTSITSASIPFVERISADVSVSDYLKTNNGINALNKIESSQQKFLKNLSVSGIQYKLVDKLDKDFKKIIPDFNNTIRNYHIRRLAVIFF